MNKTAALSIIFIAMTSAPAFAGCANYTDGTITAAAPKVIICFKDKCDKTTLDWQCSNVSSTGFGYAVGWQVSYAINQKTSKQTVKIFWKDKEIKAEDHGNLSCYAIDGNKNSCGFESP